MAEIAVNGHDNVISATVDEGTVNIPADGAPAAEQIEEVALTPAQLRQMAAEAAETASSSSFDEAASRKESNQIDVASDTAFPSLGGGPSKASAAPVVWGAGTGPVRAAATAARSNWSPAVKSAGGQQTVFTLLREDRRPAAEMRKSVQDLVRDVSQKTRTKIEVATNISRGSSTYVISGGSADDRDRAKRELRREMTATVSLNYIDTLAMGLTICD